MLQSIRKDVALFILSIILFVGFPSVDVWMASLFYNGTFFLKDNLIAYAIYTDFGLLPFYLLPTLIFFSVFNFYKFKSTTQFFQQRIYSFLTMSLVLGPGVLVNLILKDNSIGRARPREILEFGGQADFTRAFEYSGACDSNCSFVSGHASMGFFFIGLGWLMQSKRWFYIGLGIGVIVGITRIVQGGHFLSDTVFALWAVYWVNMGLGKLLKIKSPL
jgi:lipid A 4'-phosphatase